MHNVLFVISALAGAAGYALLRWSSRRGVVRAPSSERPPTPPERHAPTEDSPLPKPLPKPLRITVVVERSDQEPDARPTITLPLVSLKGDHRPKTSTTYLVEGVEVELNDFFDSFTAMSCQASPDLRHCDVVVRGNHAGNGARHVITRAAMPLAVLMENRTALVETCARALVDPAHRRVFEDRVAEVAMGGTVLEWLERHELALDGLLPKNEESPTAPPDHLKWPFVFEPHQVEGGARQV